MDNQDEIDQIMNEIENLQKTMDEVTSEPVTSPETAVEAAPEASLDAEIAAAKAATPSTPDQNTLADFRGNGDEASLEDTLASIEEEASSGTGALSEPAPSIAEPDLTEEQKLLEQEIEAQVQRPATQPVLVTAPAAPSPLPKAPAGTAKEGALTMVLSGQMSLTLKYAFEDQEVQIGFVDDCLRIELTDGTEFKIPVGKKRRNTREAA